MKRHKLATGAAAAVLAFLAAFGAVGCLISAFSLPMQSLPRLALICAAGAAGGALAFSLPWGCLPAAAAAVGLGTALWRQGQLPDLLAQLVCRISPVYASAYGWSAIVWPSGDSGPFDLPMQVLAVFLALVLTFSLCRRVSPVPGIILCLIPLFACLVVTDTVPDTLWLFSLFYSLILMLLTGHVRQSDETQGIQLTLMAALPTALALGLLFLACPRETYVNPTTRLRDDALNWLEDAMAAPTVSTQVPEPLRKPGEPDQVDLAAAGPHESSTALVMTVTAETGGTLYLRGQDYDRYDGTRWQATEHRVEPFRGEGTGLGYVTVTTERTMAQVYLPYYPRESCSFVGGQLENTQLSTSYTFSRVAPPERGQVLADPSPPDAARYLDLPRSTLTAARELLPELPDTLTDGEKAAVIAEQVRGSARYDRGTAAMPADREDFALWFLTESDTGYCVHFATAAVVLLRAADIPARYVSGYMVNANGGIPTAVTGENAHAWAEYYDREAGIWRILEATASVQTFTESPAVTEASEPASTETAPQGTEITPETTLPLPQASAAPEETTPAAPEPAVPEAPARFLGYALILAAALGIPELQRRVRLRLRRRRRGTPNDQALALWQETELLAKLLGQQPPEALEALAQKAKFSQHTLTREELSAFAAYSRKAKQQLRGHGPLRQLVYRYFYAIY